MVAPTLADNLFLEGGELTHVSAPTIYNWEQVLQVALDSPLTIDGSAYVKRVEVSVGVECVNALGALQGVHNQIRQRGGEYLVGAFYKPLSQNDGNKDR